MKKSEEKSQLESVKPKKKEQNKRGSKKLMVMNRDLCLGFRTLKKIHVKCRSMLRVTNEKMLHHKQRMKMVRFMEKTRRYT